MSSGVSKSGTWKIVYVSVMVLRIACEYNTDYLIKFVMTAWEVAGEYVYTTPGDLDTDYLMLTLSVPGYRWSQTFLLKNYTKMSLSIYLHYVLNLGLNGMLLM